VGSTVQGEPPEIFPYLGSSRLAEVIDRHGADLVLHGHAHHGVAEGKTTAGCPVHNVALPILQAMNPPQAYRVFDI
jgi:Icc-related predicted phosphoesterase